MTLGQGDGGVEVRCLDHQHRSDRPLVSQGRGALLGDGEALVLEGAGEGELAITAQGQRPLAGGSIAAGQLIRAGRRGSRERGRRTRAWRRSSAVVGSMALPSRRPPSAPRGARGMNFRHALMLPPGPMSLYEFINPRPSTGPCRRLRGPMRIHAGFTAAGAVRARVHGGRGERGGHPDAAAEPGLVLGVRSGPGRSCSAPRRPSGCRTSARPG